MRIFVIAVILVVALFGALAFLVPASVDAQDCPPNQQIFYGTFYPEGVCYDCGGPINCILVIEGPC